MSAIAEQLGVSKATVWADVHYVEPERAPARRYSWEPFKPGNEANLRHGTRSERRLAPVREVSRASSPSASRSSTRPGWRFKPSAWLRSTRRGMAGQQGDVVRDDEGHMFDVADKAMRWSSAAETWFADMEAERA